MEKKAIAIILFFIIGGFWNCASSQNLVWAKGFGGRDVDGVKSLAIDAHENVYTTGWFSDTVDFDPGIGVYKLVPPFLDPNPFIEKLDSNGNFAWAKAFSRNGRGYGYSIAVDDSENVYTTGYFQGTLDFDPDTGTYNLTPDSLDDIFVSKLDSSGSFVWAKRIGGKQYDHGFSIAVDENGNVYTTGYFRDTVDFDPGTGVYNLIADQHGDIFISKLNSLGNFVWAKQFEGFGQDDDVASSIAVDDSGNVYTGGYFNGTADFDPDTGTYILTSIFGIGYESFISKLDADGNFVFAKNMSGTCEDKGYSIVLDDNGNIYSTGYFCLTADFDPDTGSYFLTATGATDVFISKLDVNGNFLWADHVGGAAFDFGNSIAVDVNGNVYTTGSFAGSADFDPGPGVYNMNGYTLGDAFILKLSPSGTFIAAKQIGSLYSDQGQAITVDADANIYTAGMFEATVDFDPGIGIYNLTADSSQDIFIQKLSDITTTITPVANEKDKILVYPNPSSDILNIKSSLTISAVTILNSLGQQILRTEGKQETQIDISNLAAGIYLLQVKTLNGIQVKKFVKE